MHFSSILELGIFIHLVTELESGGFYWIDMKVVNKLAKIWP